MTDRIEAFYLSYQRPRLLAHVRAVARESAALAERFGVDPQPCVLAALCHDLAGVLRPEDMLSMARTLGFWLDPSEELYPFLLHQRFGPILARERLGIDDPAVLSAIACHSTLKPQSSPTDRIVFLADKLAWDQEGVPPYEAAVREALEISLAHAVRTYLDLAFPTLLHPHAWLIAARAELARSAARHADETAPT